VTPPAPGMRVAGDTHLGKVRAANEDALILDPRLGLYAVLDGMGGASAGDVAAQLARDTIRDFVLHRRMTLAPRPLLEAAIVAASTAVYLAAQHQRDRAGMGTTVVACLVVDAKHVVIAHVGDSRAYLLRGGRLQILTRDHTVVEEMLERGLISTEEAERHPYKNVLSRNLGGRSDIRVDTFELELKAGDRLLLCSDGLHGYASGEAIQYLLGSGDAPEHVSRDLIELALRGGGGDNVTTIVIEAPPAPPSSTQMVRTTGAQAWWQHRQHFLQVASDRGLPRNPIVRGLTPRDALDIVALSLCQSIFHDLEKSTGVNVWTFAQNLAAGWFERGGDWASVRGLIDILDASARSVVEQIRASDAQLGYLLDVAVSRALIVVELALGGLLAERLRQIDGELIQLYGDAIDEAIDSTNDNTNDNAIDSVIHNAIDNSNDNSIDSVIDNAIDTIEVATQDAAAAYATREAPRLVDRPTIPFLRPDRPIQQAGESAEVLHAIGQAITLARGQISPRAQLLEQILGALETIATDSGGNFAAAVLAARDIYGIRPVDDTGVMPLFDALDHARVLTATCVHQLRVAPVLRVRVLRALSTAHQRLVGATTGLVLEAVSPYSDRLREAQAVTTELRDAVAKAERQRAELERRFATIVDPNLPWGARGSTEW
jgi:PPM family protein phosphatase